jgi:hypothetical protein
MRSYTLTELFNLKRAELCALHSEIVAHLIGLAEDAPERPILLATLRDIRRVMATARPPSP